MIIKIKAVEQFFAVAFDFQYFTTEEWTDLSFKMTQPWLPGVVTDSSFQPSLVRLEIDSLWVH